MNTYFSKKNIFFSKKEQDHYSLQCMLYHHPGFKHGIPGECNDQIQLQFYSFITKEEEREKNKLPTESGWLTIVPLNYR